MESFKDVIFYLVMIFSGLGIFITWIYFYSKGIESLAEIEKNKKPLYTNNNCSLGLPSILVSRQVRFSLYDNFIIVSYSFLGIPKRIFIILKFEEIDGVFVKKNILDGISLHVKHHKSNIPSLEIFFPSYSYNKVLTLLKSNVKNIQVETK